MLYNYLNKKQYETFPQMKVRQDDERAITMFFVFLNIALWSVVLATINFN